MKPGAVWLWFSVCAAIGFALEPTAVGAAYAIGVSLGAAAGLLCRK